jgi:hypothetical protein
MDCRDISASINHTYIHTKGFVLDVLLLPRRDKEAKRFGLGKLELAKCARTNKWQPGTWLCDPQHLAMLEPNASTAPQAN